MSQESGVRVHESGGQEVRRSGGREGQRSLRMRRPAGVLGAVAADCVMMTGCPATVSVPVREEDPVYAVTR